MVLKQCLYIFNNAYKFENDVEMYGAQTSHSSLTLNSRFENDVEMYGAQTKRQAQNIAE